MKIFQKTIFTLTLDNFVIGGMENYKSNIAFATEIMFLVNVFVKTWKKGFSVENIWKTIFTLTLYNFVIGGMENYKSNIDNWVYVQ